MHTQTSFSESVDNMPRSKDRDTRRDELSDAVQRVVATRGLEGVRLRDIAGEIGVTSAAVL